MYDSNKLTYGKIFRFWYPLAATWLMMSVEGPLLSAIIARLPMPKYNLAAYGVAFAFALIIEAPVIMMLSASTALVSDRRSYHKLLRFVHLISLIITAAMFVLLIPQVFFYITENWMNLPVPVAEITHKAVLALIPWPAAIGYRRFYQGILIRYNLTRRVAYGTAIRLSFMALTAFTLYHFHVLPGAVVGGVALSTGVLMELVASRLMVHSTLKRIKTAGNKKDSEILSFGYISHFYLPLALTSFLGLAVQPMVTFMIGHSRMAIESLAVLPVINALIFVFRSVGLSFQEVAIALAGERYENVPQLRGFATLLGAVVTIILGLIAFTPLSDFWYIQISGLKPQLAAFAELPTQILILMPALSVLLSFQRAMSVNIRKTEWVTVASGIEMLLILIVLYPAIIGLEMIGVLAAAIALMIGRTGAVTYLAFKIAKPMSARV